MTGVLDVVVADKDWLIRAAISSLLSEDALFGRVVDVDSFSGAVAAMRQVEPRVLVTDVEFPDGSGIDLCAQVRREYPDTRVLFLTSRRDEEHIIAAMLAGANGYVLTTSEPRRVLAHAKAIASGGWVLDPPVNDVFVDWMRNAAGAVRAHDRITDHERKILPLIAKGKTNREIAAELYLSQYTVKTYVSTLLKKLQLARRSEAAAYVTRMELPRES